MTLLHCHQQLLSCVESSIHRGIWRRECGKEKKFSKQAMEREAGWQRRYLESRSGSSQCGDYGPVDGLLRSEMTGVGNIAGGGFVAFAKMEKRRGEDGMMWPLLACSNAGDLGNEN